MAQKQLEGAVEILAAAMPVDVMTRPVGELTAPEALGRASLQGLHRLVELTSIPVGRRTDLKRARLVGDMALGVNKLFARVAEGELRGRQADALGKLLEEIAAARVVPPAK